MVPTVTSQRPMVRWDNGFSRLRFGLEDALLWIRISSTQVIVDGLRLRLGCQQQTNITNHIGYNV